MTKWFFKTSFNCNTHIMRCDSNTLKRSYESKGQFSFSDLGVELQSMIRYMFFFFSTESLYSHLNVLAAEIPVLCKTRFAY